MRSLNKAILLGLAYLLAGPAVGQAKDLLHGDVRGGRTHRGVPSPVTLRLSAGYQGIYRDTAWTPVRVTLHNGSSADISGTLQVPETGLGPTLGSSQSFRALYQTPVTLPAGATKRITVYVPGSGVQGQVDATFQQGKRTLASGTTYPLGLDTSSLSIGVLANSPSDSGWLVQATQQQVTVHVIKLSAADIDPLPAALATFDLIVLTNVDTSQLDRAQLGALEGYVRNGGSLLLIGGPAWQETLRPLPAALLPGRVVGTRTLSNLHGLQSLDPVSQPRGGQAAAVSVLSHSTGTILATQAGTPLVVRKAVGQGVIEYLAFDPALSPVQSWSGVTGLLEHLVAAAAPLAISRTWSPQGFRLRFGRAFSAMSITSELSNLPPARQPLFELLAVLILAYVFLLGPANFLVLRWIKRQHLAWVTIPLLTVLCLGSTVALANHLRGSSVLLNSVGMVRLDGNGGTHPVTLYLGLEAPLSGDYHVIYNALALPNTVPQLDQANGFFFRNASTLNSNPVGLSVQEGSQTDMTFLAMKRWTLRDVTLDTTAYIPGAVQSNLVVDARGNLAGPIHNGTSLNLLDPVIVAGQRVAPLPNMAAGATIHARVQPSSDSFSQDQSSVWTHLYGGPDYNSPDSFFRFGGGGDDFSWPHEKSLTDRVRNASAMLSQAQTLSTLGEVVLVGWSEQPLGSFSVNGSAPQQRSLNLVAVPLSIHFPSHGPFQLRAGTLGAHLVDIVPRAPQSTCCNFFSRNDGEISVGPGGSLTFAFDTPDAGHVRFQHLALSVNSEVDGVNSGLVYDWHAQRWVKLDLSNGSAGLPAPNRFLSPKGQIVLKLVSTAAGGDLTINDPYQDLQLSGAGRVS
jgi:hypothetical protein